MKSKLKLIKLSRKNKVSLDWVSTSSNTGSIRDDTQCTSRKNCLEMIKIYKREYKCIYSLKISSIHIADMH